MSSLTPNFRVNVDNQEFPDVERVEFHADVAGQVSLKVETEGTGQTWSSTDNADTPFLLEFDNLRIQGIGLTAAKINAETGPVGLGMFVSLDRLMQELHVVIERAPEELGGKSPARPFYLASVSYKSLDRRHVGPDINKAVAEAGEVSDAVDVSRNGSSV